MNDRFYIRIDQTYVHCNIVLVFGVKAQNNVIEKREIVIPIKTKFSLIRMLLKILKVTDQHCVIPLEIIRSEHTNKLKPQYFDNNKYYASTDLQLVVMRLTAKYPLISI